MTKKLGLFLLSCIFILPSCQNKKVVVVAKQEKKNPPSYYYYIPEEPVEDLIIYDWTELPEAIKTPVSTPIAEYVESNPAPVVVNNEPLKIMPYDIPYTRRWNFRGDNLKAHIYSEHGIEISRMSGLSYNDLVNLHSYLHNGGTKFGGNP